MQVPEALRQEMTPKNILMIGPTGCGKTEIARRLAKLARAPFVKVEATKFTEVGYVGRDVESIIKDLADVAVKMTRDEAIAEVRPRAEEAAEERVLDALLPKPRMMGFSTDEPREPRDAETRQKFRKMLREKQLDEREIEIEVRALPAGMEIMAPPGMEEMQQQLQSMFQNLGAGRSKPRKVKVKDALKLMVEEEAAKLINEEELRARALVNAEQNGIVFIDELDKVCRRQESYGADVSREGVQRDLLAAGRGQHGLDEVRHAEDGSRTVHRLRRIPHRQAFGSDPGAAGPLPDPRRTRAARGRRFRPHPDRAGRLADDAIHARCSPRKAVDRRIHAGWRAHASPRSPSM